MPAFVVAHHAFQNSNPSEVGVLAQQLAHAQKLGLPTIDGFVIAPTLFAQIAAATNFAHTVNSVHNYLGSSPETAQTFLNSLKGALLSQKFPENLHTPIAHAYATFLPKHGVVTARISPRNPQALSGFKTISGDSHIFETIKKLWAESITHDSLKQYWQSGAIQDLVEPILVQTHPYAESSGVLFTKHPAATTSSSVSLFAANNGPHSTANTHALERGEYDWHTGILTGLTSTPFATHPKLAHQLTQMGQLLKRTSLDHLALEFSQLGNDVWLHGVVPVTNETPLNPTITIATGTGLGSTKVMGVLNTQITQSGVLLTPEITPNVLAQLHTLAGIISTKQPTQLQLSALQRAQVPFLVTTSLRPLEPYCGQVVTLDPVTGTITTHSEQHHSIERKYSQPTSKIQSVFAAVSSKESAQLAAAQPLNGVLVESTTLFTRADKDLDLYLQPKHQIAHFQQLSDTLAQFTTQQHTLPLILKSLQTAESIDDPYALTHPHIWQTEAQTLSSIQRNWQGSLNWAATEIHTVADWMLSHAQMSSIAQKNNLNPLIWLTVGTPSMALQLDEYLSAKKPVGILISLPQLSQLTSGSLTKPAAQQYESHKGAIQILIKYCCEHVQRIDPTLPIYIEIDKPLTVLLEPVLPSITGVITAPRHIAYTTQLWRQ